MEEKTKTFEEQLAELLALARSKKNVLEDKEILDFFRGEILSPEKLDKIYDFLENNKVDVLQVGEDMEIDPDLFIEDELAERIAFFEKSGKLIEAQRIRERVLFDIEQIREIGFCNGVENYSRVLAGREPGSEPYTLLD